MRCIASGGKQNTITSAELLPTQRELRRIRHALAACVPDPFSCCKFSSSCNCYVLVSDLGSDNLSGDDDFHAAVLLPTLGRAVVAHWVVHAKALRR